MDARAKKAAERAGYIDQRGVGRRVQSRLCQRCGRSTLTGADAPMAAMTAVVDPTPLDAYGELAAVMAGLRTYDLMWNGVRYEIDHRDEWHIRSLPPGGRSDVLAQHVCGRVNVPGQTSRFAGTTKPVVPPGTIPF